MQNPNVFLSVLFVFMYMLGAIILCTCISKCTLSVTKSLMLTLILLNISASVLINKNASSNLSLPKDDSCFVFFLIFNLLNARAQL